VGSPLLPLQRRVSYSTSSLALGSHTITAEYNERLNASSVLKYSHQDIHQTAVYARWDLTKSAGSGTNQIDFEVATSGDVSFTWQGFWVRPQVQEHFQELLLQ
jgi:hypothetical protein